jgi:uncharacterized protein (DUF1330 family)
MKTTFVVLSSMIAGAVLGAAAVQSLRAQAKPKVYSVTEIEVLDTAALATYVPLVLTAVKTGGGRDFRTGGGKITSFIGDPPKRVAIIEWDSTEQAQSFVDSAA